MANVGRNPSVQMCWELLGVSQVSALWHGQETYKQLSVFHYICWTLSPNFMSLLDAKRLWHRQVLLAFSIV